MGEQNKEHNKPIMDIKKYKSGERLSIDYSGTIQIITTDLWNRLINKSNKYEEVKQELEQLKEQHKNEIESLKRNYELENQRLRNQLAEQERKAQERLDTLKAQANRKLSEQERQMQRVQALMNRQGKGRPTALTEEQKAIIQRLLPQLKQFGGTHTIKDLETHLVQSYGYTGGYEAIRAYVADLKK